MLSIACDPIETENYTPEQKSYINECHTNLWSDQELSDYNGVGGLGLKELYTACENDYNKRRFVINQDMLFEIKEAEIERLKALGY
jgi:uncharacterized membrane protein